LKYLGEIEDVNHYIDDLRRIRFKPFRLELSGSGVFKKQRFIRILWLGIKHSQELIGLHDNIQDSLEDFKIKDEFDYHPHVTIARIKHPHNKERLAQKIDEFNRSELPLIGFVVNKFILYKSTLTSQGPVYEKIKEFTQ